MKILVAPNAFKGSLSAFDVAQVIKKNWSIHRPDDEIMMKPLADGGDGFEHVIAKEKNADWINVLSVDPIGKPFQSGYYRINNATAVMSLASLCGIATITPSPINALEANTEGLGMAIKHAISSGCKEIIIGLGGSASTDFGLGALYQLGLKCYTFDNQKIIPKGGNLHLIEKFDDTDLKKLIGGIDFYLAVDVKNTLVGKNGCSHVFAPQKGATESEVELLESNIHHIGLLTEKILNKEVIQLEGSGAAGGTAAGFYSFLNAHIMNGSEFVMELLDIHDSIEKNDLIITTEGKFDQQSLEGKLPYQIAQLGKKYNKPVIAFVGSSDINSNDPKNPFYCIFSINNEFTSIDTAIKNTEKNLSECIQQFTKILSLDK
ncbi:glycerate kinase [Flammeovirga sp. SubArs3]|uniref:glycerate kinase n=1 Tax=Flammeovirga sp. SubArs3 TaxID=2995316 RepID=UPI00248C1BD9|nr:glycerate kinase [Flammeovirga sp. SubArs3]